MVNRDDCANFQRMSRTFVFILISVFGFIGVNTVLYFSIFNQQLEFQTQLLELQAQLCGNTIEQEGLRFENELNSIPYQDDFTKLFSDEEIKLRGSTNLQKLYTGYHHLINKITVYDNHSNVYSLILDSKNNFVSDYYESQQQVALHQRDQLLTEGEKCILTIPGFDKNGVVQSNIMVDMNITRFVEDIFERYALEHILWQSLISEDYNLISTARSNIGMDEGDLKRIGSDIREEVQGNMVHTILVDSIPTRVVSVYYPVRLVKQNLGIIFSIKTGLFLRSIIIKIVLITICSLVLLAFLLYIHFKVVGVKTEQLRNSKFSEDSLRKTMEVLPVGMMFVNPDGTIRLMNRTAKEMLLHEGEDDTGPLTYALLGLDEGPELNDSGLYQHALGPGKLIHFQNEFTSRYIYKMERHRDIGEAETRMVLLFDVSEFESMCTMEKVTHKARAELLGKMGDEIKVPLSELSKSISELGDEKLTKSFSLLSNLIHATMDFATRDGGTSLVEEIPFDLRNEIDVALEPVRGNLTNLSIITKIRSDVPDKLIGDPFRLRNTVFNIVQNALDLTSEGRILISAEVVEHHPGMLKIQFNVEDTGNGLPQEEIDRIMAEIEPYRPGPIEGRNDFTGRLDIARQHVNLMKGRLWMKSPSSICTNPEQPGLKCSFTLEVFPGESIRENLVFPDVRKLGELKCLVISQEKDSENERLGNLMEAGMKFSYLIYRAENTDSLFSLVTEKAPSLHMILVMHSDTEDGIQVSRELVRKGIARGQILVLLSIDHKPEYFSICRESGIDYYIEGPFEPYRFLHIFSRHFPDLDPTELERIPEPEKINENLSILLAEDNLFNRKVIQGLFKRLGLEIDLAEDGSQAVERVRDKKYDLVFLDLLMPKMDGFQAAAELRKLGYDNPIVALTAVNSLETRKAAMEKGFDDYLIKPATVEMLRKVLLKSQPKSGSQS